ncbi:MAG: VWA domain-containing protein [Vicinamibacterales bacterium]
MRFRLALACLAAASLAVSAQQGGGEQMPRFRAGANLVRVDAYFTKDGVAVTDLKPDELEVFEDDKPQKVESFELIQARGAVASSQRVDPTTVQDMRERASSAARLFTIFLDTNHVTIGGAYHANKPIVDALDRLIGPDDMFGVMTPEMSPTNITYGSRTSSIERYLQETWAWGRKGRIADDTPHEAEIKACYPETVPAYAGLAAGMIARLREQQTLESLDGLISHLDGLRPERKFVMVFTEGWPLYQRDENLARTLDGQPPGPDQLRVDPDGGRLTTRDPRNPNGASRESCDRERVMLSFIDHQVAFRELLQRANRANVSFYPVDARGLIVFDSDISAPLPPSLDRAVLERRWGFLRDMAAQTDGVAVLDTSKISDAIARMFTDAGSYYLLRYYSSNPKLDGRFRRIGVRVKRPGVEVRARAGYLAPTEAEARAAGVTPVRAPGSKAPPAPPTTVSRALDAIAPARGNLPVRIQASGGLGLVRAVVELDTATLKQPEWLSGGTLKLVIEPERGNAGQSYTVESTLEPGQRSSVAMTSADTPIPPGRYSVRAELKPKLPRPPIQATTFVTVPAVNAEVGVGALAMRRGPSTGLAYLPTADPRFRRTERLRIEVPLMAEGLVPTAHMLTREGQQMPLIVSYSTRVDEARAVKFGIAEVALAPLAEGEYVLEVSLDKDGKSEVVSYGFRLIP